MVRIFAGEERRLMPDLTVAVKNVGSGKS